MAIDEQRVLYVRLRDAVCQLVADQVRLCLHQVYASPHGTVAWLDYVRGEAAGVLLLTAEGGNKAVQLPGNGPGEREEPVVLREVTCHPRHVLCQGDLRPEAGN